MNKLTRIYFIAVILSLVLNVIDFYIEEDPTEIFGFSIFMFNFIILTTVHTAVMLYAKYIRKK